VIEEIVHLDATELAARIRTREISPVEAVRAHLERIERANPQLNAVVTLIPDAEERARAAEAAVARGDPLGPLHGVPYTIKDAFDTVGIRTTRGSRLFADHVPERDATVVARLGAAGAIPLGKTNVPDLLLWAETDNLVFGRTSNPWNAELTAGGSSGGEAAAIAAGLSPLGVGSDLAGSIRLPAHYCGVVGLKPTHGLVPLTGHWPETLLGFMHVGFLARTVQDVALALSVAAGPDGEDWHAVPVPPPRPPRAAEAFEPLRVGVLAHRGFGAVDEEAAETTRRAASALAELGCAVEEATIPGLERNDWNLLTIILFGAGGAPYLDEVIAGRHDELHPVLRRRLANRITSLDDYVAAEGAVEELRRDLAAFFTRHDLLLCPTAPIAAHPHNATEVSIAGETFVPRTVMRMTSPFNLSGSPALTLPFALGADGLPIGVQLVGDRFDDGAVLRAGVALEQARGPWPRPPL
jgi:aspartyl-tRNA(Asn)/glutamyl-tRNA(Gln) amidotransferase subunit A